MSSQPDPLPPRAAPPRVLSFGGGVNSTALVCGLIERGESCDVALFADTGAEREETYAHVEAMRAWMEERGMSLVTVRNDSEKHANLEDECINNGTLPSLAFGNKGCSVKWKRQPQERWLRAWPPAIATWETGAKIEQLIGIDAGESHRGKFQESPRFDYRFPLIEWGWDRDACMAAIERAGCPRPGKSSCWFCPASKKREVLALAANNPDLFARAVAMEQNAQPKLGVVRGLGRHWSWESLVAADRAQSRFDFPETVEQTCGCYDESD